ncbi:MAG: hypothetical protein KF773_14545 [Deltaproteobacteria bacterium]|nr:hypothetical protein [Deltaproteobacteria bacterium]MCW5804014.1 hypothetical protein [Deltaproteobacteria bacterium]
MERLLVAYWRTRSPAEKVARMTGMARTVNELARAEIRRRYPEASPREVDLRLRSRTLDRATMIAAFGWDPLIHGR